MKKKIVGIFVITLFITTSFVGAAYNTSKNNNILNGPPKDFEQRFDSVLVKDVNGSDFTTNDGWEGHISKVNDTNDDKNLSTCDYVYIEWKKPKTRKPHHKCHVEQVLVHLEPYYYIVKFDFKNSRKCPHKESSNNYFFVDDGNIGGPWDGTRDNPFRYIQDGIDAADRGDAICVFPGTYNENIVLNKNDLTISPENCRPWGEPAEECIINGGGSGSVITINSEWVFLYGFRIQNSGNLEEDAGVDIRSDNNTIFGSIIQGSQSGIYFHDSANNNKVFENYIEENTWGVFILGDSNNNMIYSNNFIANTGHNSVDYGNNDWYSEFYNGSYWDDYTGTDSDGDGIGDTPYSIPGGSNQDTLPLINPWENQAPDTPVIDGPTTGKPGENLTYTFSSSDPNEDDMQLEIEWGDYSTGLASYDSGEDIILNHTWQEEGTYTIKAKAKDFYGAESDWTEFQVEMPKTKTYIRTQFIQFLENHPHLFPLLRQILGLKI